MRARLVISYLVLVLVALGLFTIPVAISSAQLLRSTLQDTALREARLFAPLVLRQDAAAAVSIADRTRDFQQATGSRVRLVRSGDPTPDDPQVTAALDGGDPAAVWGPNALLGAEAVSVVLPVRDGSRVVAAVQIVAPSQQVDDQIRGIWIFRLGVGLGVLAASAGIAILLAGSVVRPLRRLEAVARRLGQGDWSARAEEDGPPEVVALARTLNGSARTTEALLASQRSFVADASHQLRTPLTSVRLSLDNLRDSADDDPVLVRQLTRVEGEIDRMGRMVEGLLTLARAESSAAPPQSVDLAAVVADRADVWTPALDAAAVHLAVDVPEPCPVLVTPGACEQVLDNLVDNALAVVPRGSTVTIGARRVGGDVRLVVRDQGPGLSEEQRARAFDRFWRAGPAGTGSGLGLAIVRRLVEHDGGAVTLEPAPGGGLCVVVLLRAFT